MVQFISTTQQFITAFRLLIHLLLHGFHGDKRPIGGVLIGGAFALVLSLVCYQIVYPCFVWVTRTCADLEWRCSTQIFIMLTFLPKKTQNKFVIVLPMDELQSQPFIRSFLPFQRAHQFLLKLRQILLIHLRWKERSSDLRKHTRVHSKQKRTVQKHKG